MKWILLVIEEGRWTSQRGHDIKRKYMPTFPILAGSFFCAMRKTALFRSGLCFTMVLFDVGAFPLVLKCTEQGGGRGTGKSTGF